ncbi:MAG: AI-2E family transporter [Firmicutes bacterium]|nr:AI-2E family transporter [Bacillota bacterium]
MLASCLMPFLLALFLALILEPPVALLTAAYGSRRLAATLVFGAFLCLVLLLVGLGISTLFAETQVLLRRMMDLDLPDDWLLGGLESFGLDMVAGLAHLLRATPSAMVALFVTLFATYYLCVEPDLPMRAVSILSPKGSRMDIKRIYKHTVTAFSAYLRAQVAVMLVSMVLATLGLYLLGFDYVLLCGLLVGIAELLPVLGPGAVLLPWSLFMLVMGETHKCLGLLGIFVCITVVRQFVEPKVLGDGLGLHPLAALAAGFVGLLVFGPFGFFLGPLLLSLAWMFYRESRQPKGGTPQDVPQERKKLPGGK